MNDYVYIYDKLTKEKSLLGEVQNNFNQSFVIDGTKDTCKVIVKSFELETEVEPNIILKHENTNTWWIVAHDRVTKYCNEEGFLYNHELTLDGAIELLNARDLTDCGFNQRTYNVNEFITRLFKLANFEYTVEYTNFSQFAIDLDKMVDYVKTYENYTLLSALRDFLNGYNCEAKLKFVENSGNTEIEKAQLDIVAKTGNNLPIVESSNYFNDIREMKNMDKNSFGSRVVSNAENVISTQHKTYPTTGSVRLSSTTNKVDYNNAILRLPSKVYKGNWLKIAYGLKLTLRGIYNGNEFGPETFLLHPNNIASVIGLRKRVLEVFDTLSYPASFEEDFLSKFDNMILRLEKAGTITLYEGNKIVPSYPNAVVDIQKGDNVPYLTELYDRRTVKNQKLIFTDIDTCKMLDLDYQGIAWERGTNKITNFGMFRTGTGVGFELKSFISTDLQVDEDYLEFYYKNESGFSFEIYVNLLESGIGQVLDIKNSEFIVDYIPMSDLKIKIDNHQEKNDIQLYNQNGRLTDSMALSKLLNSHAKDISSDSITKYFTTYNLNSIRSVGQRFRIGDDVYVANNLSIDFYPNENGYYIECEYTLSKYFAVKSTIVNPNTNIRDYGIPQNFNVKRKQLYRDYYELGYIVYHDDDDYYINPENIFAFDHTSYEDMSLIAVIECSYQDAIGSTGNTSNKWYYQLETTNYYFDKMFCIALDFNDNNIIGYDAQNVFSGFDIQRIFSGLTDTLNVPVSYVDDNGNVKGIDIYFCNNEQITDIYSDYQASQSGGSNWNGNLYNYSVFIPEDIFNATHSNNNHIMRINEPDYKKDAVEVPFFEYICQVNDTQDIIVGDNLFNQHQNSLYFYTFVKGTDLNQNNVLDTQEIQATITPVGWRFNNGVSIEYGFNGDSKVLKVKVFQTQSYYINDSSWHNGNQITFDSGYDYAIFRHSYNQQTQEDIVELMFIAKNVSNDYIDNNELLICLNHYKLK